MSLEMKINYAKIRFTCVLIIGYQISNAIFQFTYHHFLSLWIKKPVIFENLGQWAVIVGVTNGLGRAFALQFANRGMNIMLIDKRDIEAAYIARNIESIYEVKVKILHTDYQQSIATFNDIHKQIEDLEIGVLVINLHELQLRPEWFAIQEHNVYSEKEVERIVNGNIHATTWLCHIFLPVMYARGTGALIIVSSWMESLPCPLMSTTSAAKAYCSSLARSLTPELQGRVSVHTVLPGLLQCRYFHLRTPSLLAPAPAEYLRIAMPLIARHNRTTGYWVHDLAMGFVGFLEFIYPPLAYNFVEKCMELFRDVSRMGYLE